jgi:hypothetical protein
MSLILNPPRLGHLRSAGAFHHQPDVNAEAGEHIAQRIGAEKVDASPQQVADARLTDAQQLGSVGLLQSSPGDRLLEPNQKIAANQQMLGFAGGKAEIPKNVAARSPYLSVEFLFQVLVRAIRARKRSRARSRSCKVVARLRFFESMEHADALGKSSHVQDAVLQTGMNLDSRTPGPTRGISFQS